MFLGPSAIQLRSQIDKKASPERSKIKQKIDQHLGTIFDRFLSLLGRFWEVFGTKMAQLGAKMDQVDTTLGNFWNQDPQSWAQVGAKTRKFGPSWTKMGQVGPRKTKKLENWNEIWKGWRQGDAPLLGRFT